MSSSQTRRDVRIALVLGGGAARGLAHIGVLHVLEREGIRVHSIAGSSMGGLIGALSASGLRAGEIADLARGFGFPRWFLPGGLLRWERVFGPAVPCLAEGSFDRLVTPLVIAAVDIETGGQVILDTGPLLPAVRATCAVPGVLPAVRRGGRWLVDGGLVNVLPVDLAWTANPDIVIAVKIGAMRGRALPQLDWRVTSLLSWLGNAIPNPATAKVSLEVLVRAAEILLDRQSALAAAMTDPEILIEPELESIDLRDFDRLDEAIAAGRRAAESTLPELYRLLETPPPRRPRNEHRPAVCFDPVCAMVVSQRRARARLLHEGTTYYFCSTNCRDCFERHPDRYRGGVEPRVENVTV